MRTGIRLCLVTGWRAVPAHLPAGVLRVERALLGAQVREALAELELPYELVSCGKGSRHRSAPPPGTHAVSFQGHFSWQLPQHAATRKSWSACWGPGDVQWRLAVCAAAHTGCSWADTALSDWGELERPCRCLSKRPGPGPQAGGLMLLAWGAQGGACRRCTGRARALPCGPQYRRVDWRVCRHRALPLRDIWRSAAGADAGQLTLLCMFT